MTEEERARKARMKDYRRRYREKHGLPPEKEYPWRKMGVFLLLLLAVGFGAFFAAQSKAEEQVSLNGEPLNGRSPAAVEEYLASHRQDAAGKSLKLTADGVEETLDLDELGADLDDQYIKDELYLVGRRGYPWQRVAEVITTLREGRNVPLALKVDDEELAAAVQKIHDRYDQEPQNAYAKVGGDNKTVSLVEETPRIVIDDAALTAAVWSALHQGADAADVKVSVAKREEAEVKKADLADVDTVLSYYTTHFDDSNPNHNENIRIGQKRLNHAYIAAGKDFSFNKYVGTRTADKGYKPAPAYFGNQLEPSVGGGICQVSTTLFNAVLRAGLKIDSRDGHFAPSGYVPVGMDATVADDGLDFVFTNFFTHPVCVYAVSGKNTITTYILGNHADTCGVWFQTTHLVNLPHKIIKKHDNTVSADKVKQQGYDGHDVTIHRTVNYADGDKYADDITTHYDPNDEIILTPGPDSETTVSTADLLPQDPLLNAQHDMLLFNVPGN